MKKAISLAAVCVLCTAVSAFAGSDPISKFESANPGSTPYQILEKLYNEATVPASLSDFDLATDASSNQHCASVQEGVDAPYPIYFARAAIVVKPGTPATPAEGPLLPAMPGTPDQLAYVISGSSDATSRGDLQQLAEQLAKYTKVQSTSTDLIQTISKADDGVNVFYARKNGPFIAIRWVWDPGAAGEIDGYAYCYRQ